MPRLWQFAAHLCTSLGEEHLARLVWVRGQLCQDEVTRGMAHIGLQGIFCRFYPYLKAKSIVVLVPRALNVLRLCFCPGSWRGRSRGWVLCSSSRTKLQLLLQLLDPCSVKWHGLVSGPAAAAQLDTLALLTKWDHLDV